MYCDGKGNAGPAAVVLAAVGVVVFGVSLGERWTLGEMARPKGHLATWLIGGIVLLALAGWLLARLRAAPERRAPLFGLAGIAFGLQWLCLTAHPLGQASLAALVLNPASNSYVQTAREQGASLAMLRDYHRRMPRLMSHAQTQGAGPVLFFGGLHRFFRRCPLTAPVAETAIALDPGLSTKALAVAFGDWWRWPISPDDVSAAYMVALLVMALAASGVVAAGLLGERVGGSHGLVVGAAAYLLIPGLTLYASSLDTVYAALTGWTLLAWVRAVEADHDGGAVHWAQLVGLGLAVGLGVTLGYLIIIAAIAGATLLLWWRAGRRARWLAARSPLLVVPLLGALLAKLALGYDLLAVRRVSDALREHGYNQLWNRPYATFLWRNEWEALVFLGLPLATLAVIAARGALRVDGCRLLSLCLAVLLAATVITGRIRGETSRMWLFAAPVVSTWLAAGLAEPDSPAARRRLLALALLAAAWLLILRGLVNVWAF